MKSNKDDKEESMSAEGPGGPGSDDEDLPIVDGAEGDELPPAEPAPDDGGELPPAPIVDAADEYIPPEPQVPPGEQLDLNERQAVLWTKLSDLRKDVEVRKGERVRWRHYLGRGARAQREKSFDELKDRYEEVLAQYNAISLENEIAERERKEGRDLTNDEKVKLAVFINDKRKADELRLQNEYEIKYSNKSPEQNWPIYTKLNKMIAKHPYWSLAIGTTIAVSVPSVGWAVGGAVVGASVYRIIERWVPSNPPKARYIDDTQIRPTHQDPEGGFDELGGFGYHDPGGENRGLDMNEGIDTNAILDLMANLRERSRQLGREIAKDEQDNALFERLTRELNSAEEREFRIQMSQHYAAEGQGGISLVEIQRRNISKNIREINDRTTELVDKKRKRTLIQGIVAGAATGALGFHFIPHLYYYA